MGDVSRFWWRSCLRFYYRHPWQLGLLVLGIALGVAVVAAVELTTQSARASLQAANDRLFGRATHRLVGEHALPEALLAQLEGDLGVTAVPLVEGFVRDADGRLLRIQGGDPLRLAAIDPDLGGWRTAPGQSSAALWLTEYGVVMEPSTAARLGVTPGDSFQVSAPGGERALRLSALSGAEPRAELRDLLLMDLGWAQELLGMRGQLSSLALRLRPEQVQAVLDRLPVGVRLEAASQRRVESEQLSAAFHLNLRALGLLALVVGLFLVYNSLRFLLLQRRLLSARFLSLGVERRRMRRWQALELTGLAVLASGLGLLLGTLIASRLLGLVAQTHADLYTPLPHAVLHLSPWVLLRVALVGVAGALLAGVLAAREEARVAIVDLQRGTSGEQRAQRQLPRQCAGAALLLGAAVGFGLWRGSGLAGGLIAVTALLLGMALLVPGVLVLVSHTLERLLTRRRSPPFLLLIAVRGLRRHLSRTGVALMALMIAVAAGVGISLMITSFKVTLQEWLGQRLNADLYVARLGDLPQEPPGLPASLTQTLAGWPEVRDIALMVRVEARAGNRPKLSAAADGRPAARRLVEVWGASLPPSQRLGYRFRAGGSEQIWSTLLQEGGALISEPLANHLRLKPGDRLWLETPHGDTALPIRGIYYDYGRDAGRVLLPLREFERYWTPRAPRSIGLYLHSPMQATSVSERVQQRWPELGLRVVAGQELLQRSLVVFERTFRVTELLRLLAFGVAFVGLFGALLALLLEREREARLLRALGVGRGALAGLLMFEAGALGLLAGLVAIPCGQLLATLLLEAIQLRAFGWSLALVTPWPALGQALLLAGGAALLASLYPAWRFSRPHRLRGEE